MLEWPMVVGLVGFAALLVLLAIWGRRTSSRSFEGYVLADRQFRWWWIGASALGSYIGGGTLVALAGKVSTSGIVYFMMPVGVALAFGLMGFWSHTYRARGPKQVARLESNEPKSLVDRLAGDYGNNTRISVGITVLFVMTAFMAVQIRAGGVLLSKSLGVNYFTGCLVLFGIIAAYTWMGGAKADALTDILQVLIVLAALTGGLLSLVLSGAAAGYWSKATVQAPQLFSFKPQDLALLLGLLLLPTFAIHTDAGIHQKILTAKSDKDAKLGLFLASAVYLFFGFILISLVLLGVGAGASGDAVLLSLADLSMPETAQVLFLLAVLAAIASTLDSEGILFSTVLVNDLMPAMITSSGVDAVAESSAEGGQQRRTDTQEEGDQAALRLQAFGIVRGWSLLALGLGFVLTLLPVGLFDFLSVVWVAALAAFSLPVLGLRIKALKRRLTDKLVGVMTPLCVLASIVAAVYYTNAGVEDLTAAMINVAFALIVAYAALVFVAGLVSRRGEITE